ncbi:hypothetical protein KJ682_05210 [bacterium]|nr:hypothetical protein [bacterium]
MNRILLLVLCLGLLCGTALADRAPVITRVADDIQDLGPSSPQTDCIMGNLNPSYWAINGWLTGAESYKYLFYADPALCPNCPMGFTVSSVHMVLRFGAEDVPSTFLAYVDFEEAIYDPAIGCYLPGPEICLSSVYTITIDAPGVYDINLPLDAGSCPCAYFEYWYGISFTFVDPFPLGMEPEPITDNFPVGCVSYNDWGQGWQDLFSYGFPGELIMYADILCCSPPVDTEGSTWGGIKTLFR